MICKPFIPTIATGIADNVMLIDPSLQVVTPKSKASEVYSTYEVLMPGVQIVSTFPRLDDPHAYFWSGTTGLRQF